MKDMLEWITVLMSNDNTKLITLLTILSIAMVADSVIGTIMAKINPDIQFSSFKLKVGFMMKIAQILLLIITVPFGVAVQAPLFLIYSAYLGSIVAEVWSILGHFKIVGDDNKGLHLMETLWKQIYNRENDKK